MSAIKLILNHALKRLKRLKNILESGLKAMLKIPNCPICGRRMIRKQDRINNLWYVWIHCPEYLHAVIVNSKIYGRSTKAIFVYGSALEKNKEKARAEAIAKALQDTYSEFNTWEANSWEVILNV